MSYICFHSLKLIVFFGDTIIGDVNKPRLTYLRVKGLYAALFKQTSAGI